MVIFKSISWKNFLSTGNQPTTIFLDRLPSILITGHNGSGKSTLLDALCYGLYNKPFRNINKPQLVNTVNDKNLVVEIEFDVNEVPYKVIRGMKPGIFEIYRNGDLLKHDASIRDYQNKLEEAVGLNYKAFTQIAVLGSARYQSFMELSTNDRRTIIEELLDITVFSKMNWILKQRNSDNELDIKETDYQKDIIKTKISGQKGVLKNLFNRTKESEEKSKQKYEEYTAQLGTISKDISKYDDILTQIEVDNIEEIRSQLSEAKTKAHELKRKQSEHDSRIKFYTESSTCHTCEQPIAESIKENQLATHKAGIDKIIGLQPTITSVFKTLEEKLALNEDKLEEKRSVQSKINELKVEEKQIRKWISELKFDVSESDEVAIKEAQEELQVLEDDFIKMSRYGNELIEQRHYFEICKILLKDEGIKSKIIKQYLPIMNQLINQNLDRMGANYSFHLDEQFAEVIKSRYRDTFSYASFSEGEKMRIDLALMFCWREIAKLKNSVNTNLLILDEVGDSSLDGDGSDILWEMIGNLEGANVFVISHRTNNADKFSSHFIFEKQGNFSKIINSKV